MKTMGTLNANIINLTVGPSLLVCLILAVYVTTRTNSLRHMVQMHITIGVLLGLGYVWLICFHKIALVTGTDLVSSLVFGTMLGVLLAWNGRCLVLAGLDRDKREVD